MNDVSDEMRNKLKIGVLFLFILFFIVYGIFMHGKYASGSNNEVQTQTKTKVVFEQPTLQIFDFKEQLNVYPDRITIHYPYLVIIRPDDWQSEIYNIDTKKKEKEVNEVLLDYFNGNMVYNKDGVETYYNDKELKIVCDRAFIRSTTEIFCVTRPDLSQQANKLISINLQTLEKKDVYDPQNDITAIYFDKGILYVGEYDFHKNKAFISVGEKIVPTADLVNVFYPMRGNMYAASFKSLRNSQTESYYEIINNSNLTTKLIKKGSIIFN